eukprot:SAG22_NODE_171_length_16646_cov_6.580528_9_plen_390_part_00
MNTTTQQWVNDGVLLATTADNITCAFTHLTDFAAFVGPSNELGTTTELFSVAAWVQNPLGLVVVLSFVGATIMLATYSLAAYVEKRPLQGEHVIPDDVNRSMYARAMLVASYKVHHAMPKKELLVHAKKRAALKMRTRTICGPLLFPLDGDPFSRSQHLMLAFILMLCALFFQVLFYPPLSKPICSVNIGSNEKTCVQFVCPDCIGLHAQAKCSEGQISPIRLCEGYSPTTGAFSQHDACKTRPFTVCHNTTTSSSSNNFFDPAAGSGQCVSGTLMTMSATVTNPDTGEQVSTACSAFEQSWNEMFWRAVLTTVCTAPVVGLASMCFHTLRTPVDRAIVGEKRHKLKACMKSTTVSAARLAIEQPHKLERRSSAWAGPRFSQRCTALKF